MASADSAVVPTPASARGRVDFPDAIAAVIAALVAGKTVQSFAER
jgi:hypothetical protein